MRALAAILLSAMPMFAQDYAPPPPNAPDAPTLKTIKEKTAELRKAVEACKPASGKLDDWAHVAIYLKAAEWIQRHGEWYTKDSGKQTLAVIDAGLERAKHFAEKPWLKLRGKPINLAYISEIDGSVQPFSVNLPEGFGTDGKKYRFDVILHGRDATLTEVKFLASREAAKAGKPETITLDIYGRGNNAYRWAGETDVTEAMKSFLSWGSASVDPNRVVIRGFSMGGAGTWHLGLHHPFTFSAMSPGAGFTVTRGYVAKFGEQPDYIERCLHIYDSADWAENLANIPCVAYSGEIDKQRAAVENVEARLKDFKLPLRYTHIIGTGLEHKQPPEWWAKVNAQLNKELPRKAPVTIHYVTYTTRYPKFGYGFIMKMGRQYEKATVDGAITAENLTLTTANIDEVVITAPLKTRTLMLDGQAVETAGGTKFMFIRKDGKWKAMDTADVAKGKIKNPECCGPIDDAFRSGFAIVPGTGTAWNSAVGEATTARQKSFTHLWDKYFRGVPPVHTDGKYDAKHKDVFFGDPGSNAELAKILPKLPITWTKDELKVNGKTYDAKTHFPVMVYAHASGAGYYSINTGHSFGEDALKGTNALLYPRLGDWAVMKLAPTKDDPHHTEVVDAGIFDDNWQFEKK